MHNDKPKQAQNQVNILQTITALQDLQAARSRGDPPQDLIHLEVLALKQMDDLTVSMLSPGWCVADETDYQIYFIGQGICTAQEWRKEIKNINRTDPRAAARLMLALAKREGE